jgi:hypothetical protein
MRLVRNDLAARTHSARSRQQAAERSIVPAKAGIAPHGDNFVVIAKS